MNHINEFTDTLYNLYFPLAIFVKNIPAAAIIPKVLEPQIERLSESTISVSWKKPEDDKISGYRLTCKPRYMYYDGNGVSKVDYGKEDASSSSEGKEEAADAKLSESKDAISFNMMIEEVSMETEKKPSQTDDANKDTPTNPDVQNNQVVKMILYGADSTIAMFEGLQAGTGYIIEIYTLCGDIESEEIVMTTCTSKIIGVLFDSQVFTSASIVHLKSLYLIIISLLITNIYHYQCH